MGRKGVFLKGYRALLPPLTHDHAHTVNAWGCHASVDRLGARV
jgi:hypothetical protein